MHSILTHLTTNSAQNYFLNKITKKEPSTHLKCAPPKGRLSDGPLGHCAKAKLLYTLWVGSAEPAHTENVDFISVLHLLTFQLPIYIT